MYNKKKEDWNRVAPPHTGEGREIRARFCGKDRSEGLARTDGRHNCTAALQVNDIWPQPH